MGGRGQGLAVCAGLCAAGASLFAKLALQSKALGDLCACALEVIELNVTTDTIAIIVWCLRIGCFGFVLLLNSLMWTCYVKSLQLTASSVVATVTNTASNFFFTAVCGWVIFGEDLSLIWWTGALLILIGLLVIHLSTESLPSITDHKVKQS